MVNHVRPNYVNPLTTMKKGGQTNSFPSAAMKNAQKKQKALEAEKQAIQNSILLVKGTAGDSASSKENVEVLEKKLEEITNELKAGEHKLPKKMRAEQWQEEKTQTEKVQAEEILEGKAQMEKGGLPRPKQSYAECLDRYSKEEIKESAGCYGIERDEETGYRIIRDEGNYVVEAG